METTEMKDLAIYGAGGLGREVYCLIKKMNYSNTEWNIIGFFDDGLAKDADISNYGKCLGGLDELNSWEKQIDVILAFGSPRTIEYVSERITNPNVSFPNIIAPDVWISDEESFVIGKGNIITRGCLFTTNVRIGDFNLFNGQVAVGHDVTIGSCNVFMPGCRLSGEVKVGNCCLIGAMSFVKQLLTIGDNVTLGPLSALLTPPKSNNTYIGNPAKKFNF